MLTETEKNVIRQGINKNQHEVYILSLDEMDHIIQKNAIRADNKTRWDKLKTKAGFTANYYATGNDIVLLGRLVGDLGYAGTQAYIKYYGGKPHIILKGRPGLRNILTGTKYGVKNAKVVKMGLGKHGAIHAAKSGGVITIILVTAYRVIDYFLTDTATLAQLIGTLATDVVKVGISTGAAIAAASAMAATGFLVAIGPLVVAIFVGVGVSYVLGELDKTYNVTDQVIAALDELSDGIEGSIQNTKQQISEKASDVVNTMTESVIDYVVENAQIIVINTAKHVLRKLMVPQFR